MTYYNNDEQTTTTINDNNNNSNSDNKNSNTNNSKITWTHLTLSNVVNNDEEYDSEVINTLYDNLLQQSLKVYSESKKEKLKRKKPKMIKFNNDRPFDCINDNIITSILNYLDLYSVIYFTQTCKKVAMANHSPYLLSNNFMSLSDSSLDSIPNNSSLLDIHENKHDFGIDGMNKIDRKNPFSFLEPIDLTKVVLKNPDTNAIIYPFAHLEINEEPELPDFDTEYVSNFINVDVNSMEREVHHHNSHNSHNNNNSINNNIGNNNHNISDTLFVHGNGMPHLDLNASSNMDNTPTSVLSSVSPNEYKFKNMDGNTVNNHSNNEISNYFTVNIQYQLLRNQ